MSKKDRIKWFLEEISRLKEAGILTTGIVEKLTSHYDNKMVELDSRKAKNIIKPIVFLLILMAALSIVGGLTLIIVTYGWARIPKEIKTFFAFLLTVIPQILCVYALLKAKKNVAVKEVFSLVLSILFGVSIAFIGQIYQLSSNGEIFLAIWALSTLVIIYIFKSITSVPLYLLISISLASVMQLNGKIGLIFYPFFLMLIPFYIMEYKRNIISRMKIIDYFLMTGFIIGLGITMEKTIPGLWIVAYANLFVVLYFFGIVFEKNNSDIIFLSPIKITGILGISILGYILMFSFPWENIGWEHLRTEAKFNLIASYFDYIICFLFPLISIGLGLFAFKKKKKFNYILPFFGLLILILYLIISATKGNNDLYYVVTKIVFLFISVLLIKSFIDGYKKDNKLLMYVSFASLLAVFNSTHLQKIGIDSFIGITSPINSFVLIYLFGTLFQKKDKKTFFSFLKVFGILGTVVSVYSFSFFPLWKTIGNETSKLLQEKPLILLEYFSVSIPFIFTGILGFFVHKKKLNINYALVFSGLILFFLLFLVGLSGENSFLPSFAVGIINLHVFIIGIYSFYLGYKMKSMEIIIFSSIFIFAVIITRFFDQKLGALSTGMGLFIIGLLFVGVNLFFTKKIMKKGSEK